MAYQTQFEGYVALKAQSGKGSIASGGSAKILPITSGAGKTSVAAIGSKQIRSDAMSVRGRHGQKGFEATYGGELQLTNFDDAFAGVMRNTWSATGSAITTGTIAVSGSTITFTGYNPLTAGVVKIFDVVTFPSGLDAADTDVPLRVTNVTASTIVVAEALTTVGSGASYSMSVKGRKLINPAGGSLVKTYYTLEEHEAAIDASTVAQDVMFSKVSLSMQADNMMNLSVMLKGTGQTQALESGSAPYFTSPVETDATPLSVIDATIRFGSGDVLDLESLSLDIDIGVQDTKVIGAQYSPDLFPGIIKVSGSITALRSSLAYYSAMLAETTYSLCILAVVPGTNTFFNIVVPYFTLAGVDPSDLSREGGPRTQTLTFPDELVGIDTRGSGYDRTKVKFQTAP